LAKAEADVADSSVILADANLGRAKAQRRRQIRRRPDR
jgi:hypothetical protein